MRMKFFANSADKMLFEHYAITHRNIEAYLLMRMNAAKMYLPCLEVPITTFCTLRCEKCSNLIQYYSKPYHVSVENVIQNIDIVCQGVDGIDCVRFLGGEPFLSPYLAEILRFVKEQEKIRNVAIVTNGTMLLPDSCVEIIKSSNKFKITISSYEIVYDKQNLLVQQLKSKGIHYLIKELTWKDKADVSFKNKNAEDMRSMYQMCPNRFFSLLNGELHICPKSAHGTDLKIVPKRREDFISLSDYMENPKDLRFAIKGLLDRPFVTACNYCNEDRADSLPIVTAAKQCSRKEALEKLEKMVTKE